MEFEQIGQMCKLHSLQYNPIILQQGCPHYDRGPHATPEPRQTTVRIHGVLVQQLLTPPLPLVLIS